MKKIFIYTIAFITLALSFSSCKKDKPETTLDKVQGKWYIQTIVTNSYYSGQDHPSNVPVNQGDYIEFKRDGNAYTSISGSSDIVSYAVSDNTITIEDNSFDIHILNKTTFVMYDKVYSGPDYDESTITLTR
jgi:hypothetical protein